MSVVDAVVVVVAVVAIAVLGWYFVAPTAPNSPMECSGYG